MQSSLNNIIKLFFMIMLLTIYQSEAQSITANSNNLFSLSISCPNNPQCIYSGQNFFSINIIITNNSNQNLEIPLKALNYFWTTVYLKNIQTGEIVGDFTPPGMVYPELLKKLTLIPAHKSQIIEAGYSKKNIKKAFKEANSNQIFFYAYTIIIAHYQGSKEPIGSYKDGKLEPKQFLLKTERVITKK